MSAYDYSGLQTTAATLLTRFGRAMTLRTRAYTTPDATKPWEKSPTATDLAVTGVVEEFAAREVDGTKVLEGDKKVHLSGSLATAPLPGMQLVDGTTVYTIITVATTKPGATPLLYTCQVRL